MDFYDDNYLSYITDKNDINRDNSVDLIKPIQFVNLQMVKNKYVIKLEECPICLQEFDSNKYSTLNDQIHNDKNIVKNKNKIYNTIKKIDFCNFLDCIFGNKDIEKIHSNELCIISCYHLYHKKCILEWLKKSQTCPLCRTNLKIIK